MSMYTKVCQLLAFLALLLSGHLAHSSGVNSSLLYINQPSTSFVQGTVLHNFQATNPVQSTVYRIEFQEGCSNGTFSIGSSNGELSVARTIDFTTEGTPLEPKCIPDGTLNGDYVVSIQTFQCFVTYGDSNGIPVVINVLPVLPTTQLMFPNTFYTGYVVEGVANVTVTILSNGEGLLQVFTSPARGLLIPNYRITGEYVDDFVVIEQQTRCDVSPIILTARPLNRTQLSSLELTLEAYESSLSTTTTIRIEILDANDHTPLFESAPPSPMISRDTTSGTEVTRFRASDMDMGLNGNVRFSIPNVMSSFTVHPLRGSLCVYSPLGLENTQLVTVAVSDLGVPPLSSEINTMIFIDDVNTFPPNINIHAQGSTVSLPESSSTGQIATTVEISDSDSTVVTLSLSNTNPCNCFQLSSGRDVQNGSQLYDILVSAPLDFETVPDHHYQVTLTATDVDDGVPQLSTQYHLQIEVTDVNEPPSFPLALYEANVSEGVPIGTHIVRIEAVDPDAGQNGQLTYTLTSSSPFASLFAIHSATGTVYTTGQLDYESITSVEFTITARDLATHSANTILIISIQDRNDNRPSFASTTQSISIQETSDASQSIFQFSASDVDSECNGAMEYSIIHQEPPAFRIDSFSGLLYPLDDSSLDFETFQNARVIVRAMDLGRLSTYSTETVLDITVTDVNDDVPVIDPIGCPCFISEDVPLGGATECSPLTAHDADSTSLRFSIVSGNELNNFVINPFSGVVSTVRVLRYEQQSRYVLGITVSDGQLVSVPVELTVIVVDLNNNGPQYSGSIQITMPQDLRAGDFVGNIGAPQSDAGYNALTNHMFQSGTPSSVTNTFKLDPLSGDLFLKTDTFGTLYTFTVVASDILNPTMVASAFVTITVFGLKNNPPRFVVSTDHRTVSASLPTNTYITQLRALDGDAGTNGQLTYRVVEGFGNHSGLFRLNSSGALISDQSLFNREGSVFTLNVSATDNGSPPLTAYQQLVITVFSSTVTVGSVELVYNPGAGVCHFNTSLIEATDFRRTLFFLDSQISGRTATYTIVEGPDSEAFQVRPSPVNDFGIRSGFGNTVFINREAVFVTLRAQYGDLFHLCSVTVVLEDIDNNGPTFAQSSYTIDVYEDTPLGSSVFTFTVEDHDVGTNAEPLFRLTPSRTPFDIDENSGVLEVSNPLTESGYSFMVTADDLFLAGPSATATAMVVVNILRGTNNAPVFTSSSSIFNVSETVSVMSIIGSLTITDNDRGSHRDNQLCIASGNEYSYYGIVLNDIIVRNRLDFETAPVHFDLVIRAYDPSPNPRFQDTMVSIDVIDENDEPPLFTAPSYTATVTENLPSQTTVLTVSASDTDAGRNGQIMYAIPTGIPFSVNPTSGLIATSAPLDREVLPSYVFNVTATDQGSTLQLSSTAEVRVVVLDENDENPRFITPGGQTITISAEGTSIGPLEAVDRDEGPNSLFVFSIVSGNGAFVFSLDPWTGELTFNRDLVDDETAPTSYQLIFQVTDLGNPPRAALSQLIMNVQFQDVNNNFPIFDSLLYECSLLEGAFAFRSNCQVHATDSDRTGSFVSYSIVAGNENSIFSINSNNGVVSITMLTDADSAQSHNLLVQAEDSGTPILRATTLVVVTIEDVNDNQPEFDRPGEIQVLVPENLPPNTLLFYTNAVDRDVSEENSAVSYSVFNGDVTNFRLDTTQGAVFLRRSLDYESTQTHSLVVLAQDQALSSDLVRASYNILVMDTDENFLPPVFTAENNPTAVTVSRNAPVGMQVVTLTANDPDIQQSSVMYHIVDGTGYGYFRVDSNNGTISTSFMLTGIEEDTVSLVVLAINGGSFPLTTKHTLTVILDSSSGTKPFFAAPVLLATPLENIGMGSIFSFVRAEVGGYADSRVCYSISGGNEAGRFAVDNSTGAVFSLSGALDREVVPTYNLTITASLPGVDEVSTMLMVIQLSDENDFRPQFPAPDYSMSLFENYPINQPFVRIFARDDDFGENGTLVYSLQDSSSVPFQISESTGYIQLTSSLDLASTSSYSLSVLARDSGQPMLSRTVSFTVTVIPAGSTSTPTPAFDPISVAVSEDMAPGSVIATASPTNAASSTLLYRLLNEPEEFGIVANSGQVYLTQSLDYERSQRHTLIILAWDGVPSRGEIPVVLFVTVEDVNDNVPVFFPEEFQFSISEHAQSDTPVGSVSATDRESGTMLTYSLVDSQYPSSLSLFTMSSSGSLRVSGDIDREEISVHVLTVAVSDGGSVPFLDYARIVVTVIDVNDHTPTFQFPLSSVPIPEDTPTGSVVHTLKAFDPDEGENAQISYTLHTTNVPFQVNSSNGAITTTQSLDFETQPLYSLDFTVLNPNNPSASSALQLNVSIVDVLDSAPVLLNPAPASVRENLPPHSFVTIVSTTDSSIRPVYYSIVDGNSLGHFLIEPVTGAVRTSLTLDREEVPSYLLTIQGMFEIGYETNVTLEVTVLDENDNGPQFPSPFISLEVPEIRATALELNLNVVDPDEGTNSQIRSYWVADSFAAEYFDFDTSGNLLVLQPLDRVRLFSSVTFTLYAFDSGVPQQYSQALVHIKVLDSNNNPPQFDQSEYTFVVSTPTVVGVPQFSVSATDADEGTNAHIRYSISGGNGTSKFAVHDVLTGEISVVNNYQLQSVYTLTIAASDGVASSTTNVVVLVKLCGFASLLLLPTFTLLEHPENLTQRSIIVDSQSLTVLQFGLSANLEFSLSLGGPVFNIDHNSGQIFLSEQLDRETETTHFIVLQVADTSASEQRIAQAEIEFVVLDVNDNAPQFDQSPSYVATITNNVTQGAEVTRVHATDLDEGINRDISYSLVSDPSGSFAIDSDTGVVTVTSPLNNAQIGSFVELVVRATDGGTPPLSTDVIVSVNIVDSRAPRFTMDVYRVYVNESVDTGTVILTVGVTAVVGGSSITYRIVEAEDPFLPFHLSFQDGVLTVVDPGVDFETQSLYRFNVLANDVSTSLTGVAVVEITVLDLNDNAPVFGEPNSFYSTQINETAPDGSFVLQVDATDMDSLPNAEISYQIDINSQFVDTFAIDQLNGVITTMLASLDYEQYPIYQFEVQAVDSGQPRQTATATVRIVTLNQNDNRPVFTQELYTGSISENALPGTNLFFVTATDVDELQDLTYSIIQETGSQNFEVSSNGLITLSQTSDLTEIQYTLNVSAFDGMLLGFTTVRIDVQDANNHRPEFNQTTYFGTVVEGASAGEFVTQVFASDMDRGINSEITYSNTHDLFTVDSVTGVITTTSGSINIDREINPVFRFIVVATDGGDRTGITNIEVTVLDINDTPPRFIATSYTVDVVESLGAGSPVLSVEAEDPDAGNNGTLVYSLSHTLMDQFIFTINNLTGLITLFLSPDHDVESEYMFTVSVRDEGTPTLSAETNATVTVNILDDVGRNPPVFTQSPYIASVAEGVQSGSELLTLQLTNASSQDCSALRYAITFQPTGNIFVLEDTAAIQTNIVLKATSELSVQNYTLFVRAECLFLPSFDTVTTTVEVRIVVRDLNDPPTFEGDPLFFSGMIVEGAMRFTPVQVQPPISAIDNDQGMNSTILYELTTTDLSSVPFDIHPRSGELFVEGPLDHETVPMYSIIVRAVDGGTPPLSDSRHVQILVLDENDSPPVFEQDVYHVEVQEGLTTNMTVFTLRAYDNDSNIENRMIVYSLSGNTFRIKTTVDSSGNSIGEIQATIDLDRETVSSYMLQVIASDGVANDQANISIVITDINDQAPRFNSTLYDTTLVENFPTGEPFVQVFATDIDIGENAIVNYSIVERPDNGQVTINSTTGEISFTVSPDYEISPVFEFQVGASDLGGRQGFTTIAVNLEDENDNSPNFTQPMFSAEIAENQPAGSDVTRVEASDADSGSNGIVSYFVDGIGAEYFDIGDTDGFITTRQSFDREMNDSYTITVVAMDSASLNMTLSSSVLVHVDITDVNDERPVFPSELYTFEVSEFVSPEHLLTTITAEDRDVGINAAITYRLTGDNKGDFMLIPNENGSVSVRTQNELNHERVSFYNLTLTAFDGGSPLQSGTASFIVTVLDENEHPPVFTEPSYSGSEFENVTIGTVITRVEATDRDPTDQVIYSILNGGNFPEISINATSGHIFVQGELNYERTPQYDIIVQASDLRDVPMVASVNVQIMVMDVNDNPPIFLPHVPSVTIQENNDALMPLGITFTAEDPESETIDCSSNSLISYEILSGNVDNAFELGRITGVLVARRSLDREARSEYQLVISASDNCPSRFSSTTNLTVIVEDVNDNPPKGGHQDIYLYLLEGVAPDVTLGQVFVNDSDIINSHTFELVQTSGVLQIENDGLIQIGSTTPELGTHTFTVTIRDGAVNQQAFTTITAVIQSVTETTLSSSSFSMQFERVSPGNFVDEVLGTFLSTVNRTINNALTNSTADVQVFGIQSSSEDSGNVDVIVAAQNQQGGSYFHPNLIQHIIHINRDAIETAIGVTIRKELVDLCAAETCSASSKCSNEFGYNSVGSIALGTRSITYLGVSAQHTSKCESTSPCEELSCSEPSYCLELGEGDALCYDDCSPNPCKNGGTCTPQKPGYHCYCLVGYDGRNCEQTSATFLGTSYAIFPALYTRVEGTISLEILTESGNGLILYSGRFDADFSDYIALELVNGLVLLKVSYGGSETRAVLRDVFLNDRVWHTLMIQHNASIVSVTAKTFNPFTPEETSTAVEGNFHSLDLGAPLIFGSLPQEFGYSDESISSAFTGCVRNVQINRELVDFSSPLAQVDVVEGCGFTECEPNPCKNGGRCAGYWASFACDCIGSRRFAGDTCIEDSGTFTFSGKDFVNYQIKRFASVRPLRQTDGDLYITAQNIIILSFATKENSGTLLQLGDPKESMEYAVLEIVNGRLQFQYNLGSGVATLQVRSVSVNDSTFHTVVIRREEQSAEMVIDDAFVNRSTSPGLEATLDIPISYIYLGASVDVSGTDIVMNGFNGCIQGARIDRKELPSGGGENEDFTTVSFTSGIKDECPIGALRESPQPTSFLYLTLGVTLPVLFIVVVVFVVVCVLVQWGWNRTRAHTVRFNRRGGGGGGGSRPDLPGHNGFSWQPATYKMNMSSPHGNYGSPPDSPDHQETQFGRHFNFDNIAPTNVPPTNIPLPTVPITDVSASNDWSPIIVEETSFTEHGQESRRSTRRQHVVSPPREGFSLVSQANPGYLEESPEISRRRDSESHFHTQSPSGHQSLKSLGSDATSVRTDDPEVSKYVHKRVEVADNDIENVSMDEIKHFKEEGAYQPLGSIGSLYDILKEIDNETSAQSLPQSSIIYGEERNTNLPSQNTEHSHLQHVQDKNKRNVSSRTKSDRTKTSNVTKAGLISQAFHSDHNKSGNILERFHNEMFGHRPMPIETSALV